MSTLYDDVRAEKNLFAAWRHVKRSALGSSSGEIRGAAAEFEHEHHKNLHRIGRQLREGRYVFDPVQGVLKDAKKRLSQGKDPRPIAIANIKDRVVQRAILQILQPRKINDAKNVDPTYTLVRDDRLGHLNDVNCSKFGVGGLLRPYGGVEAAIRLTLEAIRGGASHYYQSDIKSFFTKIPVKNVVNTILRETGDEKLCDLFDRSLRVELGNSREMGSFARLFPSDGIGVAQGASLSSFAGNVLLYELDQDLNGMGVTAVRYVDDILIVADTEQHLTTAIDAAKSRLKGFGLDLYAPGTTKSSMGECSKGFSFLGCTLQPGRCVPSSESVRRLKDSIRRTFEDSTASMWNTIRKNQDFPSEMNQSTVLHTVGRKLYGWQKSYTFCTEDTTFRQIDDFVVEHVRQYQAKFFRAIKDRSAAVQMQFLGIPSLQAMPLTRSVLSPPSTTLRRSRASKVVAKSR